MLRYEYMNILKGQDRIAIATGKHVVKIPKINPIRAFHSAKEIVEDDKGYATLPFYLFQAKSGETPGNFLFRGIHANRRESTLAKCHPELIVATRGLLGGLINIQNRAKTLKGWGEGELTAEFGKNFGNDANGLDHELADSSNLGLCSDGAVRILDGGSNQLYELLETPLAVEHASTVMARIALHHPI